MPKDCAILALVDRTFMCFSEKKNVNEDMYSYIFFSYRAETLALSSVLSRFCRKNFRETVLHVLIGLLDKDSLSF